MVGEQRLVLAPCVDLATCGGKRVEAHRQAVTVAIDQFTFEREPGACLPAMIVMQRRLQQ
ncbi:hypothetical protein D3C71_1841080 [compost metagenome]